MPTPSGLRFSVKTDKTVSRALEKHPEPKLSPTDPYHVYANYLRNQTVASVVKKDIDVLRKIAVPPNSPKPHTQTPKIKHVTTAKAKGGRRHNRRRDTRTRTRNKTKKALI